MTQERDQRRGGASADEIETAEANLANVAADGLSASPDAPTCPDADANAEAACSASPGKIAAARAHNERIRAMDQALTDLRQRSYEGKLTTPARWKRLAAAPRPMDDASFADMLLAYIEEHEHAEDSPAIGQMSAPAPLDVQLEGIELGEAELLPEPDVSDIVLLYGKKAVYLYSKPLLSHSFAHALFLTTENDDLTTFIDVVRSESRTYPRPVSILSFMNPPYLWSTDKTRTIYREVKDQEALDDIRSCVTSENETFFYSTLYLSDAQGKALAEWYGVEKVRNP